MGYDSAVSSPIFRMATLIFFLFLLPLGAAHAEELTTPCEGLNGKDLFFCWKGIERRTSRGEHETFHKETGKTHTTWHRENSVKTDALTIKAHQDLHTKMATDHKMFHRDGQAVQGERKEAVKKDRKEQKNVRHGGRSKKRELNPRAKS